MTSAAQWLEGARPRTLLLALGPVLAGTGVAAAEGRVVPWRALAALVVAVALQVGVNYANDYSDGLRGTDRDRVGPLRLVGSGVASPAAVRRAAVAAGAVGAAAGLLLAAVTSWWLVLVGAAALVAAWTYTGGSHPYGYRALGEVAVFAFFGLVAVVGTAYVQTRQLTWLAVAVAVPIGLLATAVLVVNNLRDIPGDRSAGKRTLAVVLGERRTRLLYAGLVLAPFGLTAALGVRRPGTLLALLALPLAVPAVRRVVRGAHGRDLVPALRETGMVQVAYAALLAAGLIWG